LRKEILLKAFWNVLAKRFYRVSFSSAWVASAAALTLGVVSAAAAGELELGGALGFELRAFPEGPTDPGQFAYFEHSTSFEGDVYWENDARTVQAVLVPFYRFDAQDRARTHGDLREAYVRYIGDEFDVLVGLGKVFWGVTESRHLTDIVNQDDGLEDIDGEDKLGQPMVKLSLFQDWGQVDLLVMSGFRERSFPGVDGRLRGPLLVDGDGAIFESPATHGHIDLAARYSHYFGDVDMSLSVFHGTSREPRLVLNAAGSALRPMYDQITQVGLAVQYTDEATLWKLEAMGRDGHGDAFVAVSGGVEYTLYQIADSAWDLGLLAEFHYDGRESFSFTDPRLAQRLIPFETPAPLTLFDDDVFFGGRLAGNDMQDTQLLGGAVIDVNDGSTSLFVEVERRLGDNWTAALEGRFFANVKSQNSLATFKDDGFVTVRLAWHF
jgi:hypothetical protein